MVWPSTAYWHILPCESIVLCSPLRVRHLKASNPKHEYKNCVTSKNCKVGVKRRQMTKGDGWMDGWEEKSQHFGMPDLKYHAEVNASYKNLGSV